MRAHGFVDKLRAHLLLDHVKSKIFDNVGLLHVGNLTARITIKL